ncbi:M-phase inducer phosphatase [Trachymyrmex septentrionalis]|uniref:protein-tyrosine-phosphatase n=1 Tax=Trachymyrmex septentrionalis TaxID=34720 RepID=A0A195FRQ1_9HYME|nr:PREDICTED: M-phase inducer phosphatase 3-like isoform X1 [Trachymyrmex septentrionalis]KYN43280.1 M-phase inducer phosphatase [Trachymyrmex septentrionalis]
MDLASSERSLAETMNMESPMSNIASDLSKSSLDSGSAKKRHFPRSKGIFGTSHRVNDQRNEGFLCPKDKIYQDSNDFINTSNSRGWQEFLEKNDYNKENCGAASNFYSRTPQRVHYKKVRQPLEIYEENSQDSGHPSSPINEKDRREMYVENCARLGTVPMEYSMCSFASAPSPVRGQYKTRSSTLLRSLSSGYDSMDDGIVNELNDMETMDEETQLPSGIAKLLSGDIVAPETSTDYDVSTTPDFSRTMSSKVKKWLSVQSGIYKRNIKTISPPLVRSPLMRSPLLAGTPSMVRTSSMTRSSPLEKMPLSRIRTCLFRSPTASCSKRTMMRTYSYDEATTPYYRLQMEISPHSARSYKRPSEDLLEDETSILKRSRKSNNLSLDTTPVSAKRSSTSTHSRSLQRSLSERTGLTETHTNIKWAIHRSITDSDLIGDFSKPCILPLTSGIHGDLKTITSDTLAALLRGEFSDRVDSYTIIDCRYPYEYEAGHIAGAMNIYNMDLIQQVMLDHLVNTVPKIQLDTDKRNVIIFHCEFSWERGPNLSRFLRKLDRACNKEYYPALYYPEMYLLLGGYEKFYSEQKEFCSPQDYKPMKHPNHEEECRFFRRKCKSWQAEKTKGINQAVRTNLERFAF